MILIKENPAPEKIKIKGKEIIVGPQYVMKVSHLRKEFKITACDDSYHCESGMTFIHACSLSPLEMPSNLSIIFEDRNEILDVYDLFMISKEREVINITYSLLSEDTVSLRSFKWSLAAYSHALKKEIEGIDIHIKEYGMSSVGIGDPAIEVEISSPILPTVGDCIAYTNAKLYKIHKAALISLGNIRWKKKYDKDEKAFCLEILEPLFRKMGFRSIVYNHGPKEFGKDFTFSEIDKLDQIRHYGVQVKAGDISGEINSKLDEIIGQIEDAFKIPYFSLNPKSPNYITTVLVIISGQFTDNAKEKIRYKLDGRLYGSVYFLDKQEILELIEKYWVS